MYDGSTMFDKYISKIELNDLDQRMAAVYLATSLRVAAQVVL